MRLKVVLLLITVCFLNISLHAREENLLRKLHVGLPFDDCDSTRILTDAIINSGLEIINDPYLDKSTTDGKTCYVRPVSRREKRAFKKSDSSNEFYTPFGDDSKICIEELTIKSEVEVGENKKRVITSAFPRFKSLEVRTYGLLPGITETEVYEFGDSKCRLKNARVNLRQLRSDDDGKMGVQYQNIELSKSLCSTYVNRSKCSNDKVSNINQSLLKVKCLDLYHDIFLEEKMPSSNSINAEQIGTVNNE